MCNKVLKMKVLEEECWNLLHTSCHNQDILMLFQFIHVAK